VATIVAFSAAQLLVLAPRTYDLEFDLQIRESAGSDTANVEDLIHRMEAQGLPGTIETRESRGSSVLLLTGLESADSIEQRVNEVLLEAGYLPAVARVHPRFDAMAMMIEQPAVTLGLQAVVLIVFGLGFYRWRVGRPAPGSQASFPVSVLTGLAAGVLAFVCALAVSLVQHLLGWSVEEQAWLQDLLRSRESLVSLVPLVVLVVPFAEEAFFRGYLFRFLYQRSGAAAAYLLSAGCFSVIHLHLPGMPTYFLVGLLFAIACRRTSSLTAPVVGHMTYNGLALVAAVAASGAT
jgi:hypothetical protein